MMNIPQHLEGCLSTELHA